MQQEERRFSTASTAQCTSDGNALAKQTVSRTVTLNSLLIGESACVTSVKLPATMSLRFAEMGFCAGARVTVKRKAPLGDPIEVALKDYRVCLRGKEANSIYVTIEEVHNG